MIPSLLLVLPAVAVPWSDLVQTAPDAAGGACAPTTETHLVQVPVELSEAALVYVSVSDWDGPITVGLADGPMACHAASTPPPPLHVAAASPHTMVRWLPAGTHTIELSAQAPASAIVSFSVTSPSTLVDHGIDAGLARVALMASDLAWTEGHAQRPTLAIADFSRSSTEERLWVVDLSDATLRHHLFVTHGKGSGHRSDATRAVRFSNEPYSNQTSPGLFRASETYQGDHGRSMRLDGLEPAVNDLARDRAIVIHGAEYARPDHIAEWGYLGRSHGCPAVDDRAVQALIDDLHDGGLLYARGRKRGDCCTLRTGTEASPDAPYLPDPLGLVTIY